MNNRELGSELLEWHGGQWTGLYAVGSSLFAGYDPDAPSIEQAIFELEELGQLDLRDKLLGQCGVVLDQQQHENTGALGPSMDYSNPPEGGIPPNSPPDTDFGEGVEFSIQTCDHTELPAQMVSAIEQADDVAQQTAQTPELGDAFADDMLCQEIVLRDQGPIPPPWALYPETFNYEEQEPYFPEAQIDSVDFGFEEELLAANPPFKRVLSAFSAKAKKCLTTYLIGDNAKMAKGGGLCWISGGVSLLPWTLSGVGNICQFASKGCATGCLNMSGRAEIFKKGIRAARRKRTQLFFKHRKAFAAFLDYDIQRWLRRAKRGADNCPELKLSLRMNVLSDLPWEQMNLEWPDGMRASVIERYSGEYSGLPKIQFYDYTKSPHRMMNFLRGGFPNNYYLTFSWSEINVKQVFDVLEYGGSVAVAFDFKSKKDMPTEYCGYPVINADETDFRFLDPELFFQDVGQGGFFCGLKMKGRVHRSKHETAKRKERKRGLPTGALTGGFFQYSDEVALSNEDPQSYIETLIDVSQRRAREQVTEGFHADNPYGGCGY